MSISRVGLRRSAIALFGVCLLAVAIAACGGGGGDTGTASSQGSSTAEGSPPETAPAGGKDKATGSPYTVYAIEEEIPGTVAVKSHAAGLHAAAAYIDEELGGINGHPIEIQECNPAFLDTAATATCARKAVAANPIVEVGLASVLPVSGGTELLSENDIPTMNLPQLKQDFDNPDGFPSGGGAVSEYGAEGYWMAEKYHPKKVGIIFFESPQAKEGIEQISAGFEASGASVESVLYSLEGADPTPAVAKILQGGPEVVVVIGGGVAGEKIWRSLQQQGFPMDHVIEDMASMDEKTLESMGSTIDGMYVTFEMLPWTETEEEDVSTFLEKYEQYAPADAQPAQSGWTEWGFADMMQVYNVASKISGEATAETMMEQFKTGGSVPGFLNKGLSATPTAEYAGIRNPYVRIVQVENGTLEDVTGEWYAAPPLLKGLSK